MPRMWTLNKIRWKQKRLSHKGVSKDVLLWVEWGLVSEEESRCHVGWSFATWGGAYPQDEQNHRQFQFRGIRAALPFHGCFHISCRPCAPAEQLLQMSNECMSVCQVSSVKCQSSYVPPPHAPYPPASIGLRGISFDIQHRLLPTHPMEY